MQHALYPLTFEPIFKQRVWGGRNLERLYGKKLPQSELIGESWEIADRPGDSTRVASGPLAGKSVSWLMENHRRDILGQHAAEEGPFPLLIKILDATQTLSVQVHPPADIARQLGGEPKTELWYVADATPEAKLFAGLKLGVSRTEFERRVTDGTVADCLHSFSVKSGDALFLPSGRIHAIAAGNVIFEIQENSDTTYRVFDWNRQGLDGNPRELHLQQSLMSIDFEDFEPTCIRSRYSLNRTIKVRYLVDDPRFRVDGCWVRRGQRFHLRSDSVQILGILRGRLSVCHEGQEAELQAGEFCLLPACLGRVSLVANSQVEFLHVQIPIPAPL
jgi:mannose-6-phosphate isomerase